MLHWLPWILGALLGLFLLYVLSFYIRLRRTEKTIARAVALGYKQLEHLSLEPAEQAEMDEFCRRGILQKLEFQDKQGKTAILYVPSEDPIKAELTS